MNEFGLWFSIGVEHIADFGAYDHILFVVLIVLAYPLNEWRKLLWLITAFTLGHSFSLGLSVIQNLKLNSEWVEFGIAFSILVTALIQLFLFIKQKNAKGQLVYFMVVVFGMLHGLGFSFILRLLLGKEVDVFLPLVYFNVGIEVGQLIIVGIVLVFSLFINKILKWPFKTYKLILLSIISLIALIISFERFLYL